jgi:TRAP-type uncharacterized transport system substrate-binding protein
MNGRFEIGACPGWRLILLLIMVAGLGLAAIAACPPSGLVIESGPEGGSYHQAALRYRDLLAEHGITVTIRPNPRSTEIIDNVARAGSGTDIGFIAQDVGQRLDRTVVTIGQIQLQPLFIFASAELGRRSTLDALRGRRIVMPPRDSATSEAAINLFRLYDITEENSSFTFIPLADAVKGLRAGEFDGGAFMLAPENALIRGLASDTALRLVPQLEARAIANHMAFLRPVVVPRGIYNLADSIPPVDTPLVAATVGVVARADLHPYLVYMLLEAMSATHRAPGFVNAAGEFPTLAGSQLGAHPAAVDYFKSGLPRVYRDLPPWLASMVESASAIVLPVLLIGILVLLIGPIADGITRLGAISARRAIQRIDRASAQSVSAVDLVRLERAERRLNRTDPGHDWAPLIAAIRARAGQG